jgi:hypothetical protein
LKKIELIMATWLVVVLFSVGAVALFVVGLSLTLIIKGHHIDGEISTNRNMQALGISCAVKDAMGEEGEGECSTLCGDKDCASCQS